MSIGEGVYVEDYGVLDFEPGEESRPARKGRHRYAGKWDDVRAKIMTDLVPRAEYKGEATYTVRMPNMRAAKAMQNAMSPMNRTNSASCKHKVPKGYFVETDIRPCSNPVGHYRIWVTVKYNSEE